MSRNGGPRGPYRRPWHHHGKPPVGETIYRTARLKAGLTQKQVAEKFGLSRSLVAMAETGARDPRYGFTRDTISYSQWAVELTTEPRPSRGKKKEKSK